jgi:phosphomannomutase
VDGTLVDSGQAITTEMAKTLTNLQKKENVEIGIVGGGKLDKIIQQMDKQIFFNHYFTECGCVYHKNTENTNAENKNTENKNTENKNIENTNANLTPIYTKNIRDHKLYKPINTLIKHCLEYISKVDYKITGHFIDLRNGIIYVSLIGLTANQEERKEYMELDKQYHYRSKLLESLKLQANNLGINNQIAIVEGGSVGIAIYPSEWDKIQILDYFHTDKYEKIYYFGDKYEPNGNDYQILNHSRIKGFPVNHYQDTIQYLRQFL